MFESFLKQLTHHCNSKGIRIAFAKPYDLLDAPWENLKDIDLLTDLSSLNHIIAFLKSSFAENFIMQWQREDGASVVLNFSVDQQPVFLKIDFITGFAIRGLHYMNINAIMLRSEKRWQEMPAFLSIEDQMIYLWALSRIKHKQRDLGRYQDLLEDFIDKNKDLFVISIADMIGTEMAQSEFENPGQQLMGKFVSFALKQNPFLSIVRILKYSMQRLWLALHSRQYIIAFYGVDGAGKTYLVNALKPWLERSGLTIHHCHFFPLLPWQAEPDSNKTMSNPHANPLRSSFVSIAKLFFYAAKMWLVKILPTRQTTIHLCDRYILDLVVDPVRFRLGLKKNTLLSLQSIFPAADFSFFVCSDAVVAHARKRELNVDILNKQNQDYAALLKNAVNAIVLQNENLRIEKTKQAISKLLSVNNQR